MNGCLNRRVMDGMIRSILVFIMENPGCSGQSITKRFWPALDPAHTYELLDTLVKLQAVTKYAIKKSHPITLFSKPQVISIGKFFGSTYLRNFYLLSPFFHIFV